MGGSLGFTELIIILGIAFLVFVVFGPKNLPKLGKMFGSTMKEVRKGMSDFSDEVDATSITDPQVGVINPSKIGEGDVIEIDPNRKVAKVVYEDELEPVIDPARKVAKVIYEDDIDA